MMYINHFTLGMCNSREHGVILTAPPKETFAEQDLEFISIPGRSGDLTISNGRYKNVKVTYPCAILEPNLEQAAAFFDMRRATENFIGNLKTYHSYTKLMDSYHPDTFRMGLLVASVDVESIVEQAGLFSLDFSCKPQRFYKHGLRAVTLTAPGSLRNPYLFASKPIITVYGTSAGELTVGSVTVQINALADKITLDCETMNAYRKEGDAASENKNGDIYAMEFPELCPGENIISWTGGIARVEIIPRWWSL